MTDAILDHLVSDAHRIELKGESIQKGRGQDEDLTQSLIKQIHKNRATPTGGFQSEWDWLGVNMQLQLSALSILLV